ncbi:hypothetical protein D3C78_1854700 [compost metagenome]
MHEPAVERAGPEFGKLYRIQPDGAHPADRRHLVWRRDEERDVLGHELPAAVAGYCLHALFGERWRRGRRGGVLWSVRHR